MQKLCSKGKSCGATCIVRSDDCLLELGPEVSGMVSKVRDFLMGAKNQLVETFEPLVNPKQAVDWLIENKEKLASWAMPDDQIAKIIKEKPGMITFGVEPGVGPMVVSNLKELREVIPGMKDAPVVKDMARQANGPWGDQMLKVNSYKLARDASNLLNKLDGENFPKDFNQVGKQLAAAGLNVDAAMKYMNYIGLIKDGKLMGHTNYDKVAADAANKNGKILWETANGLIQQSAGLSGKGLFGANPSGLWKPSQQFGQFKELFEAAGYKGKNIGPFSSNAAWYKYSSQQMGDKVMRVVREAQPKLMYFGGKDSDMIRKRIGEEFNQSGTFTLKTKTKDGKPIEKQFEYFTYKQPDGTSTVAMFGPHTGALGFKSSRDLMKATGEVAKALIETGVVPRTVQSAELVNVSALKSAGPRNVSAVPKAVRERQVKQTVKELRGESNANRPQVDKAKQLEGVRNLAASLAKQGYGAVRVKEELRKLGVAPALITEVT